MAPPDGRSRLRLFERNLALELEPLDLRDTIGLTLTFASLCVVSCGGVLFYGSGALRVHGSTGWIGLALMLGGGLAYGLTIWWLQPHKAVKHASHRLRHHARKMRPQRLRPEPTMTDAEFEAVEDALDQQP
jgi:hypothetical protein